MNEAESGSITWCTSSYSSNGGNCVEVGLQASDVLVRDSKDRCAGALTVRAPSWRAFLAAMPTHR